MRNLAVGLMSGTSADGVSAVLASFEKKSFQLLDVHTTPYPNAISQKIIAARNLPASEISKLNFVLGEIFARSALGILKKNRIKPERVAVIGSHGQTVFHDPDGQPPSTLQIGESAIIAERTGITVVSDFRPADVAAGGSGAPLIPYFDQHFFGGGPVRALQNIGGIANVTIVGKTVKHPIAFDTGPGNCLIDWAAQKISGGKLRYDQNGFSARGGKIWMKEIKALAAHAFFSKRPPKSTGRELFNETFIPSILKANLKKHPADVLNTLTYFTAYCIAQSYRRFIMPKYRIEEVIVSGGGAFNQTLMRHLQNMVYPSRLRSIEKFGIPFLAKEPLAFAFFGWLTMQGKINHAPSATGAKHPVILGKITPGKNFKRVR